MARSEQPVAPHRPVRCYGLLVAALLLGLLGMHGLGPVPPAEPAPGHTMAVAAVTMGEKASTPGACDHGTGDCGGHMAHADATCASASVGGTPAVVPVLQPDVAAFAEVPDGRTSGAGGGPDGGRAPPSLAELQLLRI
ncbi:MULTISPECIES: DUF6153 family protein [unclassified Streptomyces]|uniref:DUF6153 family protein n=1 Tax=unclassified Streptomyces TaxID=2593676 RepID=UPI002E2C7B9A|nr:DUF6153 family protein [Streptomyces sp. NBC_00228]